MVREDFRVVPKLYATNALTYILYGNKVVEFVETWKNFGFEELKEVPDPTVKPKKGEKKAKNFKSVKKKRTPEEIDIDIEATIKKYILKYKSHEMQNS